MQLASCETFNCTKPLRIPDNIAEGKTFKLPYSYSVQFLVRGWEALHLGSMSRCRLLLCTENEQYPLGKSLGLHSEFSTPEQLALDRIHHLCPHRHLTLSGGEESKAGCSPGPNVLRTA